MAPQAYGALNLKPWEFGQLTPGEFLAMLDGYKWRLNQEQRMRAQFVAPIINTCTMHKLKRPVTVNMLMGIEEKVKAVSDKDDMKKLLAEVG